MLSSALLQPAATFTCPSGSLSCFASFQDAVNGFEQLMCLFPVDESRTSTEAAAALGLQNTSRLKQQVCILFYAPSIIVPESHLQALRVISLRASTITAAAVWSVVSLHTITRSEYCACLLLQNQGLTAVMLAQGKLDAVAAALLLTAYFESPEAAVKVKSIKRS